MQMSHRFNAAESTLHRSAMTCHGMVRAQQDAREYRVASNDNQAGRVHCVAGYPVIISTQEPDDASASLLRNREPRDWSVRVQPG